MDEYKESFISKWNNLNGYSTVVINAHGNPLEIRKEKSKLIDNAEISEYLDKKYVYTLWILSCDAGHLNWENRNIASRFCRKVTGCVVASDGTVRSGLFNYWGEATITSVGDKDFKEDMPIGDNVHYPKNRDNVGWVVYTFKEDFGSTDKGYVLRIHLNMKEITVKKVMNNVIGHYYYK